MHGVGCAILHLRVVSRPRLSRCTLDRPAFFTRLPVGGKRGFYVDRRFPVEVRGAKFPMTKNWQCFHLFMIVMLVLSLPFGCCNDCDESPSDPGDGEDAAPDTTIDTGPEGTVTSGDVSFTWSGTDPQDDAGDLTFSWILQPMETEWSAYDNSTMADYSGLENGTYTFKVRARNTAGVVDPTPAERVFTVNTDSGGEDDTTPPDTQIVDGPEGTVNSGDVYFEWTGTDDTDQPDSLVFSWRMDSGSWSTYAGDTSTPLTGLTDGSHLFEVRARDTAGNVDPSPAIRSFVVDTSGPGDTSPPVVTITSGPSGTIDYTDVAFTYSGTDNVDPPSALQYQHRMDFGSWSAWSGNTTANYNGLADGPHTFEVRGRDTSGNISVPVARSFTVDTGEPPDLVPPETMITSGPSGTIDYSDVTFTYEGDDNVDPPSALVFQYQMDGGAWSVWGGSTMANYTGLADGDHRFRVRARDTAGNVDPTPDFRDFTVQTGVTEGVVIEPGTKNVTGDPGEYVVVDVVVTSHLNATADFRFHATSTPAHWENAYCVPGLCVSWDTVVTRSLDPGANACSIDFSIPLGEPSGTVSTIHWYVELVSDPSVSDDNVYTCTVN